MLQKNDLSLHLSRGAFPRRTEGLLYPQGARWSYHLKGKEATRRGEASGRRGARAGEGTSTRLHTEHRASPGASTRGSLCLYGGIKRVLSLHLAGSALSWSCPFFAGRISGAIKHHRAVQVQHNRLKASPLRPLAPSPPVSLLCTASLLIHPSKLPI